MSIKKKKQLSIILILSVISALMLSQPVKASDDNFENDWKYLCDWVDWDGEKLVNRSLEMYQMKSYDEIEITPMTLQRVNGVTRMKVKVVNHSKKDYENLKISIGVSNGYNDYIYNCFIAEIGELLSGESWISTNMAMNWTTSVYDEDTAIFAKSWFVNYISEKGEKSDKTKDLPSTYYAYQRRVDWVEKIAEDTWMNCSPNITRSRIMGGFKFEDMVVLYRNKQINITAKVTNVTNKELPMVVFDLYFVNKEGKEIITYGGVLQSTKSGQTVELVASATLDHALYAYDWCATNWASKNPEDKNTYFSDEIWQDTNPFPITEPLPEKKEFIKKYNWFSGSDASGLSNNSPDMYKSFSDHSRWWSFDDVKTDLINGQLSTVIRMKNESNRSQRPTKPLIAFYDKDGNLLGKEYGEWFHELKPGDTQNIICSWINRDILSAYSYRILEWEEKVDQREYFPDGNNAEETQTPTQTPTQAPTQAPTPTQIQTPTQAPTPTPVQTPTQVPTQTPVQTPTQVPSFSFEKSKVDRVKASCTSSNKIKLVWKSFTGAVKYEVFRSSSLKGTYQKVGSVLGEKHTYLDRFVKKKNTYYYKVIPVFSQGKGKKKYAKIVEAKTYAYNQPQIVVKKKQTKTGKRYLEIKFLKYEGKYADIYMGEQKKYKKLKFKKRMIRKNKGRYRFLYTSSGHIVYIKTRTYSGNNKKSPWSKAYKIKL